MNNTYTVYHLHDDTSNVNGYADSCSKYDEYIKLAKEQGMKAIAFSNHGGIYDWIKKKQCCDKNGIKYIHGVELYLCINLQDNTRGYHIGLYSKNWEGVKELNALMSLSTSKGKAEDKSDRHMYYNPRISFDELMNTSDNIIITSACLASALWKLSDKSIIKKEGKEKYDYNIKKRDELLQWFSKNRHRCFLEIQYHNCNNQIEYNKMLYKWSKEYNIPLIAGTDTHSSNSYKAECRKVLQKAKDSFYGEEDEFDLTWKTYDELINSFKKQNSLPMNVIMEAIENTNVLADMVEEFTLDKTFKYPTLYGKNAKEMWKKRILKMFKDKIKKGIIDKSRIKEYKKQIQEEFKVMSKLGMESFMMFMSELQCWCRKNDIHSSPCRGSVGGSSIAFITDIITVDPIIWKTVFSRFCNEDRISLGDIDEDYAPNDREKVYKYIIERFGNKNVAYILTLGTVQDRGAIDVLAKGLNYNDLNLVKEIKNKLDSYFSRFSKIIREEVNLEELEGATSKSPTFDDIDLYIQRIAVKSKAEEIIDLKNKWDKLREENKELFYYFDGIKGTYISKGNHPSGIIGSPITLFDNLGVFYRDGNEDFPVSFCAMKAVDSLNYVKFDILGLKTIGVIQDTYKLIGIPWEEDYKINWNDNNVWDDMLTCQAGVFQFEGDYAFELLSKFKPHAINDMSLVNASLRPSGKSYRDRLINREFNKNPSELIDNLLEANNGFLVFQEDTIAFLQQICGMSGSMADTTRRAIGKKDKDLLAKQLPKILNGYCECSNKPREIAEKEAKEFVQIIQDSSEYQFGYNHSTGYSMNGYKCARLRYYYPVEFTTAYLNNAENETDINYGIEMAKIKNIEIFPPTFRYSKSIYTPDTKNRRIYKGLHSIKYLNKECSEDLYKLRDNKYNTFVDLLYDIKDKVHIDTRQMIILIKLDFFREFGKSKKLLILYDYFNNLADKKQIKKDNLEKLKLTESIVSKFANKITAKTFMEIDMKNMFKLLESKIPNKSISLKDKVETELEYLGYIDIKVDTKKPLYYVLELKEYKNKHSSTYYTLLHNLKTGEDIKYKIKKYINYIENPFKEKCIISINKENKENKKHKRKDENGNDVFDSKGKQIWDITPNEFNNILESWTVY